MTSRQSCIRAWLHNYRRLRIRWERDPAVHMAFLTLERVMHSGENRCGIRIVSAAQSSAIPRFLYS